MSSSMDQFQLRALRRKRHVIAKNVTWDDAIIADLRSRNLLTKEMVDEIALVKVCCSCRLNSL
jgi:hypothetical protein